MLCDTDAYKVQKYQILEEIFFADKECKNGNEDACSRVHELVLRYKTVVLHDVDFLHDAYKDVSCV